MVFERPAACIALTSLLSHLDCDAFVANAANRIHPGSQVALISDMIDDPIGLSASLSPKIAKILISADPSFDLRCAAARAGIEAVIRRPVNINELSDWLEHFATLQSVDTISVLLVDDDDLTSEIHAAVLTSAGMKVKVVRVQADLPSAIAEAAPDIILMDVQMPGVDGIDLTRVIRQSREYLSIPIAFLSAEGNESRQMTARQWGGDDFFRKPVDLKNFAGLVRLRAERARAVRSLIERDSLTGLLTHGHFQERVASELDRSRRTGSQFSLAMVDLDHFKAVNDRHGHAAGDKVLRTLSRTLLGRLRSTDVIGRYGGEEFGILFLDAAPEQASVTLDGLQQKFSAIVFDEPAGSFSVTFSAGVAGNDAMTHAGLFAAADAALYQAKHAGRNRIVTWTNLSHSPLTLE